MKQTQFLFILLAILSVVTAKNKEQWASRTIYQIITDRFALGNGSQPPCNLEANTYCGGNFKGLQNHLDYIKDLGFDAIWISPIPKNYPDHFHGYAAMDIYEINKHFGSEEQFVELLKEMRNRDMWLMLDVVANHMGNTNLDFSQNVPFDKPEHYHDYCVIAGECFTYKDMKCIQDCRLAKLADLKQENPYVEKTLLDWIHDLVQKYEIEGLRIDTVPEVPPEFWSKFNKAASVYTIGEVFDGDMRYNTDYIGPLDAVLNYPYYFTFRDIWINQKSMFGIRQYYSNWSKNISPQELKFLGLFTDNHDNPRFLSEESCAGYRSLEECKILYKSIQAMTLTSTGIPILYYGSEQDFNGKQDPYNREPMWGHFDEQSPFYKFISTINKARKEFRVWNHDQIEAYADNDFYAFTRGQMLVCLTNIVSYKVTKKISYHHFEEGQRVCNILKEGDCQIVKGGRVVVELVHGEVKIFVPREDQFKLVE